MEYTKRPSKFAPIEANFILPTDQMGRDARKPVFGISDKVRFKPACSATETSQKVETSLVTSLDVILSKKRKTKALIRLRGCAGWSAPVFFANHRRQVFSRRGPNMTGPSLQKLQQRVHHPNHNNFVVCLFVCLLYIPSQQLWSLRDGQFT